MKKVVKILSIMFISLSAMTFYACSKDKDDDNGGGETKVDNTYVNNWIYEIMSNYYYWNDQIPANSDKKTLAPEDYFKSLLYKPNQLDGDRFSWIQEDYLELLNSLSGVSSKDIGFEYMWWRFTDNTLAGEVLYVKKGSKAESQGVKRGQMFDKINGVNISMSNYGTILDSDTLKINFADPSLSGNTIVFSNETEKTIIKQSLSEDPILYKRIIETGGKKIGYVVYNFFSEDKGDKSSSYDKELNDVFGTFKTANITDLVVDLRYNSGGSTTSCAYFASMLVKGLADNVFYTLKFNSNYGTQNVNFSRDIKGTAINNVGDKINHVCFLTGQWTASASEMLIHNLEPYMSGSIYVIGDTTIGKSYASTTFYKEKDSKNKWGIQPLIAFYVDKNGKEVPSTGLVPDTYLDESESFPKLAFGDENETLLKAAIKYITTGSARSMTSRGFGSVSAESMGSSLDKKLKTRSTNIVDTKMLKLKLNK